MATPDPSHQVLSHLFQRRKIANLDHLFAALDTHSRMTVFRRLSKAGYLSSYSHAGRYYTLRDIPQFDHDGLWQHAGVFFSHDGTLKKTVVRLVEEADAGQFHRELQLRLRLRVHNTLANLVAHKRLDRKPIDGEYLYVSPDGARAAVQIACRAQMGRAPSPAVKVGDLEPSTVIAVLVEVIHGTPVQLDAHDIAVRLVARGIAITAAQVEQVFQRHDLLKKTAPSRSRRSRR